MSNYSMKQSGIRIVVVVALVSCFLFSIPVYAGTKNMYLISKITVEGEPRKHIVKPSEKFTYTSEGLIKKLANLTVENEYTVYTYNNEGQITKQCDSYPWKREYLYTYKNGKAQIRNYRGDEYTIKYKNGRCVSITHSWVKYTYDYNKKGDLIRMVLDGPGYRYTYDSKGYLKTLAFDSADDNALRAKYKNTYKNGRLTKQVIEVWDPDTGEQYGPYTLQYKYKKVKVPSKYVDKVTKQQKRLILGFGPDLATY